jgi:hypothetical protein
VSAKTVRRVRPAEAKGRLIFEDKGEVLKCENAKVRKLRGDSSIFIAITNNLIIV